MIASRKPNNSRSGVAAVEFAVVLPALILIIMGCVDFGRFAYSYIAVTNAARAGAGYGIVHPFTDFTKPNWETRVRQAVGYEMTMIPDFDPMNPDQVQITTSPTSTGDWWVTVDVTYTFRMASALPGLPNPVTLQRSVTMPGIR